MCVAPLRSERTPVLIGQAAIIKRGNHQMKKSVKAVVAATAFAMGVGAMPLTAHAQATKVRIAVLTHGDGGVFWSVFQKGAEKAGKDLGITVKYVGSNTELSFGVSSCRVPVGRARRSGQFS